MRTFSPSTTDLYAGLVIAQDGRMAIAGSVKGFVERSKGGGSATTTDSDGAGQLHVWDLQTGVEIRTLRGHRGAIQALGVFPDSRLLVSGSADQTFRLWELASGRTIFTLPGYGVSEQALALSPHGPLIATNSGLARLGRARRAPTLYLWSGASGEPVLQLRRHDDAVRSPAFPPDR